MATANTHQNNALPLHATSWKQRLGLGVVAWVALGVATAVLDPRHDGAGVIGLCGGFGAWLATGAGLAAAYTVAHAAYRRAGAIAGLVAGALCLAVVGVLLAAIDWNAVASGAMIVVCSAIGLAIFLREPQAFLSSDEDSGSEEWRWGSQGPGWYRDDMLIWPDQLDDE